MLAWLCVALGSALGGMLRYGAGLLADRFGAEAFWSTALINLIGCFAIGLLMPLCSAKPLAERLLIIGLLGGFTTFSSFSWQTIGLIDEGRFATAIGYVTLSLVGCLAATALGWKLILLRGG